MDRDDGNDDGGDDIVVYTVSEILITGLKAVNYTDKRINAVKQAPTTSKTNIQRFKNHYGVKPLIVAQLFEDLQITKLETAKLTVREGGKDLYHIFESLHFLRCYKTESNRESTFDVSPKTIRQRAWVLLEKIALLKHEKIIFPKEFGNDIWLGPLCGWRPFRNK